MPKVITLDNLNTFKNECDDHYRVFKHQIALSDGSNTLYLYLYKSTSDAINTPAKFASAIGGADIGIFTVALYYIPSNGGSSVAFELWFDFNGSNFFIDFSYLNSSAGYDTEHLVLTNVYDTVEEQ